MDIIRSIEEAQMRTDLPEFGPGDTLKVHVKVVEGDRERIQVFEGVCIKRDGGGLTETFTVRKISQGEGLGQTAPDRKSTRLNSSHVKISYAVFCLKKKKKDKAQDGLEIDNLMSITDVGNVDRS